MRVISVANIAIYTTQSGGWVFNIEEFDIKGNLVRGLKGETEKYKEFLINSDFDIITNFAAQQ